MVRESLLSMARSLVPLVLVGALAAMTLAPGELGNGEYPYPSAVASSGVSTEATNSPVDTGARPAAAGPQVVEPPPAAAEPPQPPPGPAPPPAGGSGSDAAGGVTPAVSAQAPAEAPAAPPPANTSSATTQPLAAAAAPDAVDVAPAASAEAPAAPPPAPAPSPAPVPPAPAAAEEVSPVDEPAPSPAPPPPAPPVVRALDDGAAGPAGVAAAELVGALESLMGRAPYGGCLLVRRGGETVFGANAGEMLVPASLQKLVLAEAALRVLGPDYTFTTTVLGTAAPTGGELPGDLYLVGGGDPLLSTPHFVTMLAKHRAVGTPLDALAADLVGSGLTRISGGVVAVADRYDAFTGVPDWPARFAGQSIAGSLSAVAVNQGWVAPPGIISTWGLSAQRAPAQRAAEIFDDLLEARSVRIPLRPRVAERGGDYGDLRVLASVRSAPLVSYLDYLLAESDNSTAEMLLKEIGLVANRSGTSRSGAAAVHAALAGVVAGLPVPADGSGLSPSNRLSCNQIADVLELRPPGGLIGANLGLVGVTGTVENRYRNSSAAGLVRAKTGSLNGVSALAGFAGVTSVEPFTFVVIFNSGDVWLNGDSAATFFRRLMEILVGAT